MNEISIFLANNYIWFIIIVVLLLFALVGYFFEAKNKSKEIEKTEILDTIKYDDNVEELNVQTNDKENVSINEVVDNKKEDSNKDLDKTEIMDIPVENNSLKEEVKEESTFEA